MRAIDCSHVRRKAANHLATYTREYRPKSKEAISEKKTRLLAVEFTFWLHNTEKRYLMKFLLKEKLFCLKTSCKSAQFLLTHIPTNLMFFV